MGDIADYEQTTETMAFLMILALGNKQVDDGKIEATDDVIRRIRDKQKDTNKQGSSLTRNS